VGVMGTVQFLTLHLVVHVLTTRLQMVGKFKPLITLYLFTPCCNKQLCFLPTHRTCMRLYDSRKKSFFPHAPLSGWTL